MTSRFQPPPTWALPVLVDERTGKSVFNPVWLKWFVDLSANLSGTGGTATPHNSLTGLQGGSAGEFYHLTAAQRSSIQGGYSGTITTAKLTPAGANGSMTFTNGVLTAQTAAT